MTLYTLAEKKDKTFTRAILLEIGNKILKSTAKTHVFNVKATLFLLIMESLHVEN